MTLLGHDFLILSDMLSGTTTQYNMSRLSYEIGVTYYINIVAYSYSGVHMTATSDGFTVDHLKPTSGMVYDGIGKRLINNSEGKGLYDQDHMVVGYIYAITTSVFTFVSRRPLSSVVHG